MFASLWKTLPCPSSLASACLREAASAKAGTFLSSPEKNHFFRNLLIQRGKIL
jgi:hypothetical protein